MNVLKVNMKGIHMVSRRKFFTGLTAASLVMLASGGAMSSLIMDPRVKAWALLDESDKIFKSIGKSPAYFAKADELFDHLALHFKPTVPPSHEDAVRECGDLLKRRGKYDGASRQAHWRTCYNSTFAVMIIRDGLKYRKLPMIQASRWKPFARNFTKIVMAA